MAKTFNIEAFNKLCGTDLVTLFNRNDITEIYVNDDGYIRYLSSKEGKIKSQINFSPDKIKTILGYIAGQVNKVINEDIPTLDTDIPYYGFRLNANIYPIVNNPQFNIRKKSNEYHPLEEYVEKGTLSPVFADYLLKAIKERKNILIVGGTNSGKTTFLKALLFSIAQICPLHRIISLEDMRELECPSDDYSPMITQQDTGKSEFLRMDMTRLLKTCMRRSPDRIIVGEVRDGAAYTMLKAWNTGHPGGVCTVHANNAKSGLQRIKALAREDSTCSSDVEDLIGEAIQVIVSIQNEVDKKGVLSRKISEIIEVNGFNKLTQDYEIKPVNS